MDSFDFLLRGGLYKQSTSLIQTQSKDCEWDVYCVWVLVILCIMQEFHVSCCCCTVHTASRYYFIDVHQNCLHSFGIDSSGLYNLCDKFIFLCEAYFKFKIFKDIIFPRNKQLGNNSYVYMCICIIHVAREQREPSGRRTVASYQGQRVR